jgi:protoporphyrin/coproporphyrin ferrochelatase
MADRRRVAIVLFNLGGPDSLEAVRPFLTNLFRDKAILRVPFFVRPFLARLIAKRRTAPATENYRLIGGSSPLLGWTERQARALEATLEPEIEARCFIAMRYWHPFAGECAAAVKQWDPAEILLLPLYPQFSSTTTASSLDDWRRASVQAGLVKPVRTLCCWFDDPSYIAASATLLRRAYDQALAELPAGKRLRLLFSAHGLPESIVRSGDPYQFQIEATAAALRDALALEELDSVICYQSRVTPEPWLGPSTDEEVERAGREGVGLLVMPIAFVSEHSETLAELDIEYGALAAKHGVPLYRRVLAQNDDGGFIAALAGIVRRRLARLPGLCSHAGGRLCPSVHGDCPLTAVREAV